MLGREAAHGRNRILHVKGDTAGRAIMPALMAAVRATPSISVHRRLRGAAISCCVTADVQGVEIARSTAVSPAAG